MKAKQRRVTHTHTGNTLLLGTHITQACLFTLRKNAIPRRRNLRSESVINKRVASDACGGVTATPKGLNGPKTSFRLDATSGPRGEAALVNFGGGRARETPLTLKRAGGL